jgi:hypothetical protein
VGKIRSGHFLNRAKDEALFACDLYNERRREPNLEAFVVHMQIAWLNLLMAIFERDGIDYYYRNGRRFVMVDGERKTWDVTRSVNEYFRGENDPCRHNLLFFVGLRNKIEHRLTAKARRALGVLVAGRAQSFIANLERVLVKEFGAAHSLADELRFPIFLSSLTTDAVDALKAIRGALPHSVTRYISDYDRELTPETRDDQAYEFRVMLIPLKAPKTLADAAITYVDERNLTAEQRTELEKMTVIVRERFTEVAGSGRHVPSQVVQLVKVRVPGFLQHNHTDAWRFFNVRPMYKSTYPERTTAKYCVYDVAFRQYVYTDAWVEKLIGELTEGDPAAVMATWHNGAKTAASDS